jgi:hypothetical protein
VLGSTALGKMQKCSQSRTSWPLVAVACLLFNACNQKRDEGPAPSITVQLPPPRPYAPPAPAPGFSAEALAQSYEEPPMALASPIEAEESQNSL